MHPIHFQEIIVLIFDIVQVIQYSIITICKVLLEFCKKENLQYFEPLENTMFKKTKKGNNFGNSFLIKGQCHWLPASLREGVAAKHFTDPQQLAEYADTLWEAQPRLPITAAVLSGAPPHPAVSPCHGRSRASSSSQPCSDGLLPCSNCLSPRSRFSPGLQPPSQMASAPAAYICYYHEWFEAAACNYRPSCAWLENSGAGSGN